MKILFYSFLIALTVLACNNGKAEKQESGTDADAVSKPDTTRPVNFPGTAVYIQLPKGFVWSETAMGFYKEEDGSVIKYDEFKKIRYAANMPVENSVGTLTSRQSVTISGYKGELKTFQQGSTGIQLELAFGDSTFMAFIEATYFSHQEETGKEILTALKNIQVKKQ